MSSPKNSLVDWLREIVIEYFIPKRDWFRKERLEELYLKTLAGTPDPTVRQDLKEEFGKLALARQAKTLLIGGGLAITALVAFTGVQWGDVFLAAFIVGVLALFFGYWRR